MAYEAENVDDDDDVDGGAGDEDDYMVKSDCFHIKHELCLSLHRITFELS